MYRRSDSFSDYGDEDCGCCTRRCVCIVTLVVLYSLALVFVVGGCIAAPIGATQKNAAAALDPETDFKNLGESCVVKNIDLKQRTERETRRHNNREYVEWKCYHDYTYLFTYQGTESGVPGDEIFKTRTETILVLNGQCPPYPLREIGRFAKGTTQECWRPTGTPNSKYRCGNDACIKLFSPSEEKLSALNEANSIMIAGIVIITIGVLVAAIAGLTNWCVFCRQGRHGLDEGLAMQENHASYPMQAMPPPMQPTVAYNGSGQQPMAYGQPSGAASAYPPPTSQPMQPAYGMHNPQVPPAMASSYPMAYPVPQPGYNINNPAPAAGNNFYPLPQQAQTYNQPQYPQYPQP